MRVLFIVKDTDIEHLNIMLLGRLLKDAGHEVAVCEARLSRVRQVFRKQAVDMLAYSVPTFYAPIYLKLNERIKQEHKVFSVFGGPHPTLVPEMIENEGVDCICRGEGEYALLELAEALSQGKDITRIKNLWVKQDGQIHKNDLRPLVEDLDGLPFPDRSLFPFNETYCKGKMHVMTSRGCPHDCAYCCHPAYARLYSGQAHRVRRRSVTNVIEEARQVLEQTSLKLVMFEDDLFVSDHSWIRDFCARYPFKVGVPFFCYVRADRVDQELVAMLRSAGCISISMGLETADERLRQDVLGRRMSNERILQAAAVIKQAGIRLETTNILGIPGGSLAADLGTLEFNIACKADYSSVKLLVPYPGTKVRENGIRSGALDSEKDVSNWRTSFHLGDPHMVRATENLRRLFALTVAFPFLLPLVKRAIYWPLGGIYTCVFLLWEGYTSFFRLYPTGAKGFFWGMLKYLRIFREGLFQRSCA